MTALALLFLTSILAKAESDPATLAHALADIQQLNNKAGSKAWTDCQNGRAYLRLWSCDELQKGGLTALNSIPEKDRTPTIDRIANFLERTRDPAYIRRAMTFAEIELDRAMSAANYALRLKTAPARGTIGVDVKRAPASSRKTR